MVSKLLSGLFQQARDRIGGGRSKARRPERRIERRLTLESLEGRELLAVAILSRSWKELDFSGPATVSGNLSGKYGSSPVSGRFNGNMTLSGELNYSSPTDAVGQGAAVGTVNGSITGYGALPTLNLSGDTGPGGMNEVAGKFSAVLPPSGALGATTLTGTINTRTLTASGGISFTLYTTIRGSGSWSANVAPTNPQPLTVATTAQWDTAGKPGVIDVEIQAGGSVQKAATRATPVATVSLYWGTADGVKLTKLPDSIPILWNQADGSYEISKLPVPPATAAKLLVVTTFGTTTNTTSLDLPAPPTISINSVSITPPATGFVDAVFTVTLSGNTAFPVSVNYATVNGTAVKKQDFTAKSGVLTFLPGESLTQTITIKVKKDATVANQDFGVQLSKAKWGTLVGTGKGIGSIIDVP